MSPAAVKETITKVSNQMSKQPVPTKTDVPHSDADAQTCYLWIHLVSGYDRVITFPSVKQAYLYAEQYVFETSLKPDEVTHNTIKAVKTIKAINTNDVVWTAADGITWVSPDTCWDITLTKIYDDITAGTFPEDKQWDILSTCYHQMVIGLGTDLSEDCVNKYCTHGYTLEDHNKPEDMPPLLHHYEPRFTGSAFGGDEKRYGIDAAAAAALLQQEQHQENNDDYHEFDYEHGRWYGC